MCAFVSPRPHEIVLSVYRNEQGKVIPVIIWAAGTISKSFSKYQKSMKSRNYKKQPYWALHMYFRNYYYNKSAEHLSWEITLYVT